MGPLIRLTSRASDSVVLLYNFRGVEEVLKELSSLLIPCRTPAFEVINFRCLRLGMVHLFTLLYLNRKVAIDL